jgi:hypothetical protein
VKAASGREELQPYLDLLAAFESVAHSFVESSWFNQTGRVEAVDNVLYLERLFIQIATEAGKMFERFETATTKL